MARWEMNLNVSASEGSNPMKPRPDDDVPALRYGSMSLEEIQEGVSAEAVGYAAGLLVEALRHYESDAFSARQQNLTLTEAQMIAANLIAKVSAHLDDKTMEEQMARVRRAIREVKS
jgi:hypothetical protein